MQDKGNRCLRSQCSLPKNNLNNKRKNIIWTLNEGTLNYKGLVKELKGEMIKY